MPKDPKKLGIFTGRGRLVALAIHVAEGRQERDLPAPGGDGASALVVPERKSRKVWPALNGTTVKIKSRNRRVALDPGRGRRTQRPCALVCSAVGADVFGSARLVL